MVAKHRYAVGMRHSAADAAGRGSVGQRSVKAVETGRKKKQGRKNDYPSRVRVGRGSDGGGHWSI